mmetsp:Transcript_28617/g.52288  ORF Transcript_28617/g.52288 Transcript_28617/m.52288 type:complete len:144 (+) Transcript_28617:554-985(+)
MASTTAAAVAVALLLPLADDGSGVLFREEAVTGVGEQADVTAENLLPYCACAAPAPTVPLCCLGETGLDGLLRGVTDVRSTVVGVPLGMDTLATRPGYPPVRALRAPCGGNLGVKEPVTEELPKELLGELTFGVPTEGGAGPE